MHPNAIQGIVNAAETGVSPLWLTVWFVVGTLVSEDLTCITAGLLVAHGVIHFLPAMLATLLGIYIGDMLLYLTGRYLGAFLVSFPLMRRVLAREKVEDSEDWFQRRGPIVILISRFVPGSRMPVYVAAGMLRLPLRRVALYFALAGLLWTPALVGLSAIVGGHVIDYLRTFGRAARWVAVALGLAIWLCVRLVVPLFSFRGRRLLVGRLKRLVRWEFWPRWAFYPPVVAYIAWQMFRHRSCTVFTAANPGIPLGGFVGESKADILDKLQQTPEFVARFRRLDPADQPEERVARYEDARRELGLDYPLVLKPNEGQRGEGVAIIRTPEQARRYLARAHRAVLLQEYVPGIEFGVFYARHPAEPQGHIFSVTEKQMPFVVGDGPSTLEQLILRDPRAVCMAPYYLHKNRDREFTIVPAGESVQLVELGTHCRGAIFLNGARVVTPAFEGVIDRISRGFAGFHFGRYDIRTQSVEDLRQGRNFKIVELNGVTSEATHIYDPRNALGYAYAVLCHQWRMAFEIGAANVARGAVPARAGDLWRAWRDYEGAPEMD